MNRFRLLFVCLAVAACGGEVTTTTTHNRADETATNTAAQAPTTGEPWPIDTPGFAPAYPGAAVTTVGGNTTTGSTSSIITFNTRDSPAVVVAFYQAQATKAGLARIAALSTKQSSLFSAGDPASGRALTIQAAARNGHTAAALTVARARQGG